MRALSAALLTLALLSGIVPLAVLSSSHSCSMPCCAGVEGGCATGACQGALFKSPKKSEEKKEEGEKLCGAEVAGQLHGSAKKAHERKPSPAALGEAEHCDSEQKETASAETTSEPTSSSGKAPGKELAGYISSRALAAPCAEDCCAAASPSTQSRRGRDTSLAFLPVKPPPPALLSYSYYTLNLQFTSNPHLKRLKARAPPRD